MYINFKSLGLSILMMSFCGCGSNNSNDTTKDSNCILEGFDYKDSKESPMFFLAAKSERNFVSETTPLSIDFYFGHNFYDGSYYCDTYENEEFGIELKTNDVMLYSKTIADFNDKKYDCVENKKIDYKNNFVTIEFSWEQLNGFNSNSVPFELKINRISYPDWSGCKFYFWFVKDNNMFTFKTMF